MLTVEPSRSTTFPSRRAKASRPSLEILVRSVMMSVESAMRRGLFVVWVWDEPNGLFIVDALPGCSQLNGLIVAGQEMYRGFRGLLVEGEAVVAESF